MTTSTWNKRVIITTIIMVVLALIGISMIIIGLLQFYVVLNFAINWKGDLLVGIGTLFLLVAVVTIICLAIITKKRGT